MAKAASRAPEPSAPSRPGRLSRTALALVFAAAVAPYLFLPSKPFYNDADFAVARNVAVQERPLAGLWTSDFWGIPAASGRTTGSWRPLTSLTYAVQARTLGPEPGSFHLADVALHGLCAILLALLIVELIPGTRWAAGAATLFAVHPAVSDAVCSVTGRADMLAGAGFLGAMLLHLRAASSPRRTLLDGAALACLGAAMLSKEYAVAFPFVLVAADAALHLAGRPTHRKPLSRTGFAIAAVAVLVAYLAARHAVLGSLADTAIANAANHPLFGQPFPVRAGTAAWLLVESARLLILPFQLCYLYGKGTLSIAASGLADPRAWAGVALLGGLGYAAWRALRRDDVRDGSSATPAIALTASVLALLPALNLVGLTPVFFAERFLYVPAAGLALVAAWVLHRFASDGTARRVATGALVVVGIVFGARTMLRVDDWASTESLARAAIATYPNNANAWSELGAALGNSGRHEDALEAFRKANETGGDRRSAWAGIAQASIQLGRPEDAEKAWRKIIEIAPDESADAWKGLAELAMREGRMDAASTAIEKARQQAPGDASLQAAWARLRLLEAEDNLQRNQPQVADRIIRETVASGALPPEGMFLAGLLMGRTGDRATATEYLRTALDRDPDLLAKQEQAASQSVAAGRFIDAANLYLQLIAVRPKNAVYYFQLGDAYLRAGAAPQAALSFRKGLELQDDPKARELLAEAERRAGK